VGSRHRPLNSTVMLALPTAAGESRLDAARAVRPRRTTGARAAGILLAVLVVTGALRGSSVPAPSTGRVGLQVPPGFRISTFATGLGAPRMMALDPAGTLLLSIPSEGRIVALPDPAGRGTAEAPVTVVANLDLPHGLAFRGRQLYVAETGRVRRFSYDPATFTARDPVVVIPDLPAGAHHWSRTIAFGPEGMLYVAVGSSCDVCRETDRRRASILRYHPDGSGGETVAAGLRNAVGLAFQPETGRLWTAVNERDWRSGGAPRDFITEVRRGARFGWPDCFFSSGRFLPDPEFPGTGQCIDLAPPTIEIPPHSAPLGLAFYTGLGFPDPYRGNLFVALHGSRPGLLPAGYKVIRIAFEQGRPSSVADFVTGWHAAGEVRGRPVDVLVARDGSLFISDDHAGVVHRVISGYHSGREAGDRR
jgi:glucose/arabinose dehydrogenase